MSYSLLAPDLETGREKEKRERLWVEKDGQINFFAIKDRLTHPRVGLFQFP
jgi:hypothetical protein